MRIEQTRWTDGGGWKPELPGTLALTPQLVLVFGGTSALKQVALTDALRAAYPRAHVMGCSTAGEICDTQVTDDSLVVTAVEFEHSTIHGVQTRIAGFWRDRINRYVRLWCCYGGSFILADGVNVRLAYLCNVYPAVSHSFIRREIEGLEALGHEVHRFSVRPAQAVCDEADLREGSATQTVLAHGAARLTIAALRLLIMRPARTFAALVTALRLSPPGYERKLRHLAYWLEAAWLVRRLEQLAVEHLHAHFGTNPAAVAAIVRAWGGPPFSFTAHGPDEFDAPVALSLSAKIEQASFVFAISKLVFNDVCFYGR